MTKLKRHFRIGTRESKLALIQTDMVVARLKQNFPDAIVQIEHITTGGDKVLDRPIAQLGGRGVFVKELEEALLANRVDLVVHSLKDLPTELPEGLTLASVLNRTDPRDIFVSPKAKSFMELPAGSTVATSSRRRAAQLLALRKDLTFVDMRGNIPTRLRKLAEGQCDAMILAAAGLLRLELKDEITEFLSLEISTPAVGQGALGIECRANDKETLEALCLLEDAVCRDEVEAERAFLDELGSGCSVPAGALARASADSNELTLTGCVAALDGSQIFRDSISGPRSQAFKLGKQLASILQEAGAEQVLKELRLSTPNVVSPP